MGVGRKGAKAPWILKYLAKKVVFWVLSGKNKSHHFWLPPGKILEKYPCGPSLNGKNPSEAHVHRFRRFREHLLEET